MSFQLASQGSGWRTRPDKEKQFSSSCGKGETVGVRLLQSSTHYQRSISSCWYLRESPQIPRPEFRVAITTKYHKRELVPSYLCIPAPVSGTATEILPTKDWLFTPYKAVTKHPQTPAAPAKASVCLSLCGS